MNSFYGNPSSRDEIGSERAKDRNLPILRALAWKEETRIPKYNIIVVIASEWMHFQSNDHGAFITSEDEKALLIHNNDRIDAATRPPGRYERRK